MKFNTTRPFDGSARLTFRRTIASLENAHGENIWARLKKISVKFIIIIIIKEQSTIDIHKL